MPKITIKHGPFTAESLISGTLYIFPRRLVRKKSTVVVF
jgi:hypothetical protein